MLHTQSYEKPVPMANVQNYLKNIKINGRFFLLLFGNYYFCTHKRIKKIIADIKQKKPIFGLAAIHGRLSENNETFCDDSK